MSDGGLNQWVAEGDNAAEAGFTPDPPASPPDPEGAHLWVNKEAPTAPIIKWWDGSAWVTLAVIPARTITAGAGLTGGGDLSANRTLDVGAGTGITVNANDVAVNQAALKLDDWAAPDDNTDLDASTTKHGLLLKATAPASGLLSAVAIGNGETVYSNKPLFDTTNPAALGTAGPGTQVIAARRDHIHTMPKLDDTAAPDDNTDLDASTTTHGLLVKATAPGAGLQNVVAIRNGETAYVNRALFDTTTPAAVGIAAAGTSLVAARRDHVHAMQGCCVVLSADITAQNFTTAAAFAWDTEEYDDNAFHDAGTPSRLTVPAGVTRVNLSSSVRLNNVATGNFVNIAILKNGAVFKAMPQNSNEISINGSWQIGCAGFGIPCTGGDYFEVFIGVESDTSVDVESDRSFFSIQVAG